MRNFFVAVEGLSGSGKTTVAQGIAQKTKAILYKTPPQQLNAIRHWIDRKADLTTRYFFYLTGVIRASLEIEQILKEHSVVCDRYLLTTECYHKILGVQTLGGYDQFQRIILVPDISILIVCSEPERQRRLDSRGLSFNDQEEEKLKIAEMFDTEYRKHPLIEIKNDGNLESTIQNILDKLKNRSLWRG